MHCQFYIKVLIFYSHTHFTANKCFYKKFLYGNLPHRVALDHKTVGSCHPTSFHSKTF